VDRMVGLVLADRREHKFLGLHQTATSVKRLQVAQLVDFLPRLRPGVPVNLDTDLAASASERKKQDSIEVSETCEK
jgi:hypothetical protein